MSIADLLIDPILDLLLELCLYFSLDLIVFRDGYQYQ
jgi:hypothetical protein